MRPKISSLSSTTDQKTCKIALLGNPNSGKTSLFNALTGLRQKIGNYPGVTVDKKTGYLKRNGSQLEIIDFPGTYSVYPNSTDERIVIETITNPKGDTFPDVLVYVASAMELEKHFLLATQLKELGLPMLFCITMQDISERKGVGYRTEVLSEYLECKVVVVSALTGSNLKKLEDLLFEIACAKSPGKWKYKYEMSEDETRIARIVSEISGINNLYANLLIAHHFTWLNHLDETMRNQIGKVVRDQGFESTKYQIRETLDRFNHFSPWINKALTQERGARKSFTERIDSVITHKVFGPFLFFLIMMLVFHAIFSWSEWPMGWIEQFFAWSEAWVQNTLPPGWLNDLISNGIIAGLGGIMVFIPQIAILFLLISLLEEIGYMSRAVFMFDNVMQRFGLNGRSIVALISGGACAIPAIMSTRTISNWKERLITILVTPLISCSARIPVYTILIAFAVPKFMVWGIFNSQALAFMGLYVLGILAALFSAMVFSVLIKSKDRSFLMIELPHYRKPTMKNVIVNVKEKVWTFVSEAGKIILIISVILWFLASFGPAGEMQNAAELTTAESIERNLSDQETQDLLAAKRLEASYAGKLGKWFEPAIKPLGFDWKMGIALITSFAAREVFVGTMATIYSVGSSDDEMTLREKMAAEINADTGGPRYDIATALSLLVFYVFALQCMSTMAITKRETKTWKWPIVQFTFMGLMAYLSSLAVYQILI